MSNLHNHQPAVAVQNATDRASHPRDEGQWIICWMFVQLAALSNYLFNSRGLQDRQCKLLQFVTETEDNCVSYRRTTSQLTSSDYLRCLEAEFCSQASRHRCLEYNQRLSFAVVVAFSDVEVVNIKSVFLEIFHRPNLPGRQPVKVAQGELRMRVGRPEFDFPGVAHTMSRQDIGRYLQAQARALERKGGNANGFYLVGGETGQFVIGVFHDNKVYFAKLGPQTVYNFQLIAHKLRTKHWHRSPLPEPIPSHVRLQTTAAKLQRNFSAHVKRIDGDIFVAKDAFISSVDSRSFPGIAGTGRARSLAPEEFAEMLEGCNGEYAAVITLRLECKDALGRISNRRRYFRIGGMSRRPTGAARVVKPHCGRMHGVVFSEDTMPVLVPRRGLVPSWSCDGFCRGSKERMLMLASLDNSRRETNASTAPAEAPLVQHMTATESGSASCVQEQRSQQQTSRDVCGIRVCSWQVGSPLGSLRVIPEEDTVDFAASPNSPLHNALENRLHVSNNRQSFQHHDVVRKSSHAAASSCADDVTAAATCTSGNEASSSFVKHAQMRVGFQGDCIYPFDSDEQMDVSEQCERSSCDEQDDAQARSAPSDQTAAVDIVGSSPTTHGDIDTIPVDDHTPSFPPSDDGADASLTSSFELSTSPDKVGRFSVRCHLGASRESLLDDESGNENYDTW